MPQTQTAWDGPEGIPARGTVVVLTGRGETATSYGRLGRRLATDAWKVRAVAVDLDDLDAARAEVRALLADADLPAPHVLLGADSGATLATQLAAEPELSVDGVVVAGIALASSATTTGEWDDELEARTACPTHRRVITEDPAFDRAALARPLPADLTLAVPTVPTLVLHGSLDPVTSSREAFASVSHAPSVQAHLVEGAHHDVLNDVMHRSTAATVVLFLERLKLGASLPQIVRQVR